MNFDYLRLFFAVTVMTGHVGYGQLQLGSLWNSELAVFGFFCLSGYVITLSYQREPDLGHYVRKRVARIYPPILVTVVALMIAGLLYGQNQDFMRGAFSLLLFQDWLPLAAVGNPIYAHGAFWTLVVEVQFYALVPAVIWCWKRWPMRTGAALGCVAAAAVVSRATMPLADLLVYRQNVFTVAHFFIAGMLSALCLPRLNLKIWPALKRAAPWGDLSFGIYLYHFPVLTIMGLAGIEGRWPAIAATIVAAFLSWHLIEKPIMRLARSSRLILDGERDVRAGPHVGRQVPQHTVAHAEDVQRVGALKDAAK